MNIRYDEIEENSCTGKIEGHFFSIRHFFDKRNQKTTVYINVARKPKTDWVNLDDQIEKSFSERFFLKCCLENFPSYFNDLIIEAYHKAIKNPTV